MAMKAPASAQRRLLDLNKVDTTLVRLAHRRKSLPEHAEVLRIQAELATIDDELTAAETAVADGELEQRRAEADLEPVRERRRRDQARIDAGDVDAKALRGLVDEVAHLDRRIGELEDAQLEVMEQLEQATATRDEVAGRRAGLDTRLKEAVAARTKAAQAIDTEAKGQLAVRAGYVVELPRDLFALYEKIRQHVGSGAAALVARRCEGCGLAANASDLRAYAAAAADDVLRCAECGRILIRTPESGL
ncbi:zinc ribbon domain-containing protein [Raineyella sp. W15-4]|uniref:zinc ribbon domain-containing protein n=1 Tax=Raineyella sp. W15-4 TaxID=3081651 RepID=UPI0029547E51|nr:C4-type zinc ribbon domain-containing protein [Raineyella sp. W15-4]WOQ15938.1 nucleic acid-binding protein [Raineyella sp. W15-4]